MDINSLWDNTLSILSNELTDVAMNTWFVDLVPARVFNKTLYVYVNATFNQSILNSRYRDLTRNALTSAAGESMDIQFILEKDRIPGEDPVVQETRAAYDATKPTPSSQEYTGLNPKYTFEKFVIGENNRFAQAACVAVAESPSERYNPLFIYGGVGLGKTHLMQSIGNYIQTYIPNHRVLYVSCETFTNEFINCIRDQNAVAFRAKYRNVDTLLIDDIQFLANKEGTQEEFFHTFNALNELNKQIVVTSDRPPREISNLTDRLRSRFEMGLMTDISTPNLETRIAILRKKAESYHKDVPNDVLNYIATNIQSNIRELEGALTTIFAYNDVNKGPINLTQARIALRDHFEAKNSIVIDANYIKTITAGYFNVTPEDLDSKRRTKNITTPRQVAMYLIRELTELSLPKIGEAFGGRDHTTVIHSCSKVVEEMEKNTDFKNLVIRIQKEILNN